MPALTKRRREAFAHATADGANYLVAGELAGYRAPRNCRDHDKMPDIAKRIAEIRRARAGGGSREFGEMIDEVLTTALQSRALGTAQGMAVSRAAFDLIGKYKDKLPGPAPAPPPPAVPHPDDADITEEEWTRLYGPNAPGKGCDLP